MSAVARIVILLFGFLSLVAGSHAQPRVRYTRRTGRSFDEQGARGFFVQSVQDQAEFLVGFSF